MVYAWQCEILLFFRTAVNESFKLNLLANIIWIYRLWCKSFTLILITCIYLFLYASIFPCAHTSVRLLFFMCTNWNPLWLMWLMFSIDKWKSHSYTNGVSEGEKERKREIARRRSIIYMFCKPQLLFFPFTKWFSQMHRSILNAIKSNCHNVFSSKC